MKKTIKYFKIFIKYINKIIFGIFKIDIITKTKQFLKKKELYIEIDISKKKNIFLRS